MKKIISKLKSLFSKETKQTEKPSEIESDGTNLSTSLSGIKLLNWWKTIDPDSVIINVFSNGEDKGCVIGHYMRCISEDPTDYSLNNMNDHITHKRKFRTWTLKAMVLLHQESADVSHVNNGNSSLYSQETPYLRVQAFFKDVVEYENKHGQIVLV